MTDPKQVIVIRKDLGMRKGKMVVQGAHASVKIVMEMMSQANAHSSSNKKGSEILETLLEWVETGATKICVGVNSEEELISIYKQAQNSNLPRSLITDEGRTEFKEPTFTAVAIGPTDPDEINKITGELKLL